MVIKIKTLYPYQQQALDTLLKRLKQTTHPLLVNASVGAGKSLIIAELLLVLERGGMRALCLTLNSTLIQQNSDAYKLQQGQCGIYCAGLDAKDTKELIIFGSPNSVCKDISNKGNISRQPFNLIVVDEAHNIHPHDSDTMYQRIINHYGFMAQQDQYSYRVVGLTGTPYRGKGNKIIGDDQFFKEQVCDISTSWLIEQDYLTRPYFGIQNIEYNFSKLRVNNMGKFNAKKLQQVVDENERLTGQIMRELVDIMKNHTGAFIFASTRKHCLECAKSLPNGEWAIVTGKTPHEQRKIILENARSGIYKYLISVGCLNVGVDVPSFDVCAWLRPTESLVLYTQGIGRVLRLHPGKQRAIVLDYAGNLQRHGDIDDPIINAALQPQVENEKEYVIPCYTCNTNNTVHARRCIGILHNKRCDHYFDFKDCTNCNEKNDITSRTCRICDFELIDPNAKLKRITPTLYNLTVTSADYWASVHGQSVLPVINAKYNTLEGAVFECYLTNSARAQNIFYGRFLRLHFDKSSAFYPHLARLDKMREMIASPLLKTPHTIVCRKDDYGRFEVVKKLFHRSHE